MMYVDMKCIDVQNMHNPANNYANLNNYNTAQNKNQKYYTNYKK